MSAALDYNGNKGFRLLSIYERLNKGEVLNKAGLAVDYGVGEKTVQRDVDDLRAYLAEEHQFESEVAIKYDRLKQGYYLVRFEREWLTNDEVLALCKILLESRAFEKGELNQLISKLLAQAVPNDRKVVDSIIRSELACYVPLRHEKKLLSPLWQLSQSIAANKIVQFTYRRKDGVERIHSVKPVAVMFSEFYFYLIAYMADNSKEYPTVFRIDRMSKIAETGEHFKVPYNEKFSDGEFRKRVQFMYSGELQKVTFEYSGSSIESVLDRLPTAEVLLEKDGVYTVMAEVYGDGIDMWLRSQGNNIK
ncbi:MAG: WYL domain-containing protein [Oscillospiraceae bacterium]|nr:WYL domain-containing protein [Oscillospiraceae bacterium]